MSQTYTLTEAKAKLSEIISRVHFSKETFTITRKGKPVAVVQPIVPAGNSEKEEGLICAKGVLKSHDNDIDELVEAVYRNREEALDRKVTL